MLNVNEDPQSAPPANDNVEIGYGKPPAEQQFKPGQSGNVKGRPKGAKNKRPAFGVELLKSTILMEVYNEIEMHEGEETITLPKATVIVRKMLDKAVGGDTRAAQIITAMVQNIERENRQRLEENLQIAADYRKYWYDDAAYRKRVGLNKRDTVPEPKNVMVNLESGDIEITGPLNEEERAQLSNLVVQPDGSTGGSNAPIPTRKLVRAKNMPSGFWHGQFLLRKAPTELPRLEDPEPSIEAEPVAM